MYNVDHILEPVKLADELDALWYSFSKEEIDWVETEILKRKYKFSAISRKYKYLY